MMIKAKEIDGFTLIELLITILIVSILATISANLYLNQARKSRRADATDTLTSIALAEERYRTSNTTYGTLAQVWGGVTTSPQGFYSLSISNVTATGYTLTATAVGTQASDSDSGTSCASIQVSVSSGNVTRTPAECWPQ